MIYSKTNEVQSRMRCSHISLYAYILSKFYAYPAIISCPYLKIVNLVWIKKMVSNDCESTNLFRVWNKPCIYTPQYLSKVIECYPFNNQYFQGSWQFLINQFGNIYVKSILVGRLCMTKLIFVEELQNEICKWFSYNFPYQ